MKLKLKQAPFNIRNNFYNYQTIDEEGFNLQEGRYYVIFQFKGQSILTNFGKEKLLEEEYIEIVSTQNQRVCLENGLCVVLDKKIISNKLEKNFKFFGKVKNDAYHVEKPWGYEYWITGECPNNELVLKFIHIKKGTKTSLQVHNFKYESNFLVEGEAIFRYSEESFSTKKEYPIKEISVNPKIVIDVAPLGIHQLESKSDIYLIEASTNHLDDVIRLKDDSGRGDGKIDSEHKK